MQLHAFPPYLDLVSKDGVSNLVPSTIRCRTVGKSLSLFFLELTSLLYEMG